MKQFLLSDTSKKTFVLLFLAGQLCVFAADYISGMFDMDIEHIEILDLEDRESDEKEDNQEEEDSKLKVDESKQDFKLLLDLKSVSQFRDIHNIIHKEISTPPPR